MAKPERGKMLGDDTNWAEVNDISAWSPKIHALSVTDIGKKNKDTLTVTRDGKSSTMFRARIHYGGPFFSEGCATSASSAFTGNNDGKKGFENFVREVLPSLNNNTESTYIQLPSQNWWSGYYYADEQ